MLLKELKEFDYIPKDGYYATMEWYVGIVPRLKKVLNVMYGEREVIFDVDFCGMLDREEIVDYIKDCIDVLFIEKRDSYSRIWNVLRAEYNPIWNVESKETLTYSKKNEGNEGIEESSKGESETSGSNTGSIKVEGSNTGSINVEGSNTGTVSDVGSSTGESVSSLTPFNSSTLMVSDKGESETSDSNTRTDDLKHGETRTDDLRHGETRTDDLKHSETTTDSGSRDVSKDSRYSEDYEETRVRGGNIGVTKSSELVESEIHLRVGYSFVNIVARDIVNMICYGC